jgi:hypothetical protein
MNFEIRLKKGGKREGYSQTKKKCVRLRVFP